MSAWFQTDFGSGFQLVSERPSEEALAMRRELTLCFGDELIESIAVSADNMDTEWDLPWRLYGIGISLQDELSEAAQIAEAQLFLVPHELLGATHPLEAWSGKYVPEHVIGVVFVTETHLRGKTDEDSGERITICALADGRTSTVLRTRDQGAEVSSEPTTGRVYAALLKMLCAPTAS